MYKVDLPTKERWIYIFEDYSTDEPDYFMRLVKKYFQSNNILKKTWMVHFLSMNGIMAYLVPPSILLPLLVRFADKIYCISA